MCADNAKKSHQHYMWMEKALRGVSTELRDGIRRFVNAPEGHLSKTKIAV